MNNASDTSAVRAESDRRATVAQPPRASYTTDPSLQRVRTCIPSRSLAQDHGNNGARAFSTTSPYQEGASQIERRVYALQAAQGQGTFMKGLSRKLGQYIRHRLAHKISHSLRAFLVQ